MADITKFNGYDLKDKQLREDILETKMYLGYTDENVIGLLADFENNTFTRLGGAVGKSAGADFNVYNMYGNRKVCAVQDDGTISKWWGEDGYVEDGSIGQIMVRQPKFYYKVVPLKLQKIENGQGYHLRKAAYYISDKPLPGFKLHPAFVGHNGEEADCYYIGSYEASLWDASENEYRKYDTWDVTDNGNNTYTINALDTYVADATSDKLCSIAGVKPAGGEYSTQFIRPNVNQMAKNRGSKWTGINYKMLSAEQLLFIIEYASFNSQSALANGVCTLSSGNHNESVFTGATSELGNASGSSTTYRLTSNGVYESLTSNDKCSVRYRGAENLWGNMMEYIHGVNLYGDGTMLGGIHYYCTDFNYAESKNTDNYVTTGITGYNTSDYVSAFGYSEECDWAFIMTDGLGTSALPVGDRQWYNTDNEGYRIKTSSGYWGNSLMVGIFYSRSIMGVGRRDRTFGGRLAYID